jgi:hypothetical protein
MNVFGSERAPAALLTHGLCGKEQCECFCLARLEEWRRGKEDNYVRPDAENAPDIVYACKSNQSLSGRRRRLDALLAPDQAEVENQRRAALAAQTKETKSALRQFYGEIGGAAGLASSVTVMARLLGRVSTANAKPTVAEIWEQIFWDVAEHACQIVVWDDNERTDRWDMPRALAWIDKVRRDVTGVGPLPQPSPGDSQRTGWEAGWDDDDEGMYLMLLAYPKPLTADDIQRIYQPRVALRMIEECEDKNARGMLWRHYNELQARSETGLSDEEMSDA